MLNALSFRLMVMDHMNKLEEELARRPLADHNEKMATGGGDDQGSGDHQVRDIELEVNRVIYQKQSENIVAFKELWEKE